jgi:hypothetical protein
MIRGWARTVALFSFVPLAASLGCDALNVRSFSGAIMQFTIEGAKPVDSTQAPNKHLEVWARDQYNDIIRINPFYDENNYKTAYGLMIRQAISENDPCIIDDLGNLLTTAAAYPTSVTAGGVTQTPEEQAQAVLRRIRQLNPQGQPALLAIIPWDSTPPPTVAGTASPADRKAACEAYAAAGDNTYIPNPYQVTAPKHGAVYGFAAFTSLQPPTSYDGFRLDVPVGLKGLQEIFVTLEGDTVDPNNRGQIFWTSTQVQGGRDVLQFVLSPAAPDGPSGAVAVYVNLDEDPVQF